MRKACAAASPRSGFSIRASAENGSCQLWSCAGNPTPPSGPFWPCGRPRRRATPGSAPLGRPRWRHPAASNSMAARRPGAISRRNPAASFQQERAASRAGEPPMRPRAPRRRHLGVFHAFNAASPTVPPAPPEWHDAPCWRFRARPVFPARGCDANRTFCN